MLKRLTHAALLPLQLRVFRQCMVSVHAGVQKAVGDYEELAKDSEVDIVYVSNIHPAHKDTTLLLLEHGKHVLCEKPLAVSLHHALPPVRLIH